MLVAEGKESRVIAETTPSVKPTPKAAALPGGTCVKPAVLTGALLWACHFPLSWGWLGWIALVPLLTLTRVEARSRRIYWSAYLGGLAFFLPALQWMRVADARMYATWLMLAFYCAAYFPLGLWLIRLLDRRRLPLCLSVPLVWVGLEWVRSFVLTGFAWYYLGHAQYRFTALIQIADLGGVYAISFLVAAVNGWLVDLAFHIPALRDRFRWREDSVARVSESPRPMVNLWLQGGLVAALLVAAVLYGAWRLEQTQFTRGPRVALLQTNIPQSVLNNGDGASDTQFQKIHLPFAACLSDIHPDLIVWPESSYIRPLIDYRGPVEKIQHEIARETAELRLHFREVLFPSFPSRHLLGINTWEYGADGKATRFGSALLIDENGNTAGRFDKIHRVPFGEYVPFRDSLPFMKYLAPYGPDQDYDIRPGKTMTRFPVRNFQFGTLICFEDSDAALARNYAQHGADGKPVDFLVNISNDGWFADTCEHEEHLVVSLFRAIENRRSLVRSVNQGISAVIDANGRIMKPRAIELEQPDADHPSDNPKLGRAQKAWEAMGLWHELKAREKKPADALHAWEILPDETGEFRELSPAEYAAYKNNCGVLFATVPIDRRSSVYAEWGDWLPIACWTIFGLVLLMPALFGRRRRLSRV